MVVNVVFTKMLYIPVVYHFLSIAFLSPLNYTWARDSLMAEACHDAEILPHKKEKDMNSRGVIPKD